MTISLNAWTPRGGTDAMTRIYVSGLAAKAYIYQRGGRTVLNFEGAVDAPKAEQARLSAWLVQQGLSAADAEALAWSPLLALAHAKQGRAKPAAPTRVLTNARVGGQVTDRLVNHGMDLTNIPLEMDALVRLDHREPDVLAQMLRMHPRIRVEVVSLKIGDVLIESNGKTILVERKTVTDLEGSIKDGRVFDQAQRIGMLGDVAYGVVIHEGNAFDDLGTVLPQSLTGAITCLGLLQGMVMLQTLDIAHTAWAIVKLAHHAHTLGYELSVHRQKPAPLLDARTYALQALPGVSGELAARLLAHFGSVRAVMAASEADLQKVPGIGAKTAKRIVETAGP